ncbi:MAG TPA: tyrosine-type recombinase/integrase [Cytophagaceae bacterium]|jgi:integrase/recombinase XerC|nr:tyrosine-type recombinase/integrase [Cytophagaceae bacterium]
MVSDFLKYIQYEKRFSKHTLTSYQNDLDQYSAFLQKDFEVSHPEEASYSMIRSWIVKLAEQKMVPKTINRKIAALRSYYKFLLRNGKITKDPTIKIRAPKVKKSLPVFVEQENLLNLLDSTLSEDNPGGMGFTDNFEGVRDRLIMELLYGTGIRLSELIEVKNTDINFYQNTLKVLGKGNKERIIPMNTTLVERIKEFNLLKKTTHSGNSCEYLIVTNEGKKTYPMFVYRTVRKYLDMSTTVEKRSPHVLRHSFATHLLNKGADLNAIKDLLGHTSLAATQVYTHNSLDKLKAIFNQAHPKS